MKEKSKKKFKRDPIDEKLLNNRTTLICRLRLILMEENSLAEEKILKIKDVLYEQAVIDLNILRTIS
ncbi:MAG: hypothetical protein A3F72_17770 [Bacteroidetes bacterium RIFCSPLOWO2_12_FULL_35_15]|nr:MAG: hypothetical protein A3F72_17770 [Bacteroidetes bacterium RIFCSPLOWO2_12_FULL_35_15]